MSRWGQSHQKGYVLIATITLGLAISIISSTFLEYIITSNAQLTNETYTSLTEEAAEAGAVYAADCIGQYSGNWSTLRPNTACDGTVRGSQYVSSSTVDNFTLRSTFSVAPYIETSDNYKLSVTGTLEILQGSIIVKTYSTLKTSLISKAVALVSTTPPSAQQATALSVDKHACVIANGQLYCWGDNTYGQLGLNDVTPRSTPTKVPFFASMTVTKVAVGMGNTCAIADGRLYCWGDDTYGQVGNSVTTTTPYRTPQLVTSTGSNKVTDISLSQSTTTPGSACAVIDGAGYCWGRNNMQQLGVSASVDVAIRNRPTAVYTGGILSGRKITRISIGDNSACALAVGSLVCWGGKASPAAPPTLVSTFPYTYFSDNLAVTGNTICTTLSFFYHSLACYGQSNAIPALSTATTTPVYLFNGPVSPYVSGGSILYAQTMDSGIDGSNELYCITAYARPWCAGTANTGSFVNGRPFALLDTPELNNNNTPGWGYFHATSTVGAGNGYGCPLSSGSLFCWGRDTNGTLANNVSSGTVYGFPLRVAQGVIGAQVNGTTGTTLDSNDFSWTYTADGAVSVGNRHSCAIVNGYSMCWGANDKGQLGTGNTVDGYRPVTSAIILSYGANKVSAGGDSTCAVSQGRVFCWGDNSNGKLALDPVTAPTRVAPTEIPFFTDNASTNGYVSDVSVGETNACAITGDVKVFCWGKNDAKQVGASGAPVSNAITTPTQVTGLPAGGNITAISVGYSHACAIVNSDLYCWGTNGSYELGNTTSGSQYATKVNVTGAFTAVSAGKNFTCAILNGVANCWGANDSGQLATALSTTRRAAPAAIASPGNTLQATAISAGDSHACAVLQGASYCWGRNSSGQVGNGTPSAAVVTPYKVTTGAMSDGRVSIGIGAGDATSCNVANGLINCWGDNSNMQAGAQSGATVLSPVTTQWYRYELNRNKGIFY